MVKANAANPQFAIGNQSVNIIAETYSIIHRAYGTNETYEPYWANGLLPEQVLDTIHVEGKGEAEGLVQRVAFGSRDDVAHIQ